MVRAAQMDYRNKSNQSTVRGLSKNSELGGAVRACHAPKPYARHSASPCFRGSQYNCQHTLQDSAWLLQLRARSPPTLLRREVAEV